MYTAYAGEDEIRWGYRLLFVVGVLTLIGAIAVGADDVVSTILGLVRGAAAILAGVLLRRRSRTGVLVGIGVGAVGVAFSAFTVVLLLRTGLPIPIVVLPLVGVVLSALIVRTLFMAEPYVRSE